MSDSAAVGGQPSHRLIHMALLLWLGVALLSPRPGDGDHYLYGDSLHYAAIAKSTLASGDLLALQLAGEPYFKKPPLLFWMAMSTSSLGGDPTWMAELVGVLCGLGVIAGTYLLVRRLTDERHAFLAAVALAFTYVFVKTSVALRFASPLTLALLFSLWTVVEGERRRWLLPLFWVGAMIGVGLKGPAGLLCLPVLLIRSLLRRRAHPFNVPVFWLGVPLVPLLILPWVLHNDALFGQMFWDALRGEVSNVAGEDGSGVVLAKYVQDLGLEYWPWLPFFLHGVFLTVRAWWRGERGDRTALPLAWILGVSIVLLSLNRAYSRYVVPMLPASSLLVAVSLLSIWPRLVGRRLYRGLAGFLAVGTAVMAFTPVHLHGDRRPDVVKFHDEWLATEGKMDQLCLLDVEMSWQQQSAAVFYCDTSLELLPPEQLLARLAERQPIYAMVPPEARDYPPGVAARVVDRGREYELVELRLTQPGPGG